MGEQREDFREQALVGDCRRENDCLDIRQALHQFLQLA